MSRAGVRGTGILAWIAALAPALAAGAPVLSDGPDRPGEWGFRPADGSTSQVTPPAFVWRRQKDAASYALQCARKPDFTHVTYEVSEIAYNCHCPPEVFAPGQWYWRYRFTDKSGTASPWSSARGFVIPDNAVKFPMPPREELLARIPKTHPRLFVRPEDMGKLRQRAKGDLKPKFDAMIRQCEKLIKSPPDTTEPPRYPKGTVRKSEEWRKIWWGNRRRTQAVLSGAATLAFARLLGGKDECGHLAKKLLLAAAEWDPKGATGYRYNDEAGMPYAYHFSRAYTLVYDLLNEAERDLCREVMKARGDEMYAHLCPRHLWRPYSSHSNRAWHFLGEVGIAFLDEVEGADDWVWFAMNVFYNVYPVWCDDDGGWHEGMSYWNSYVSRFTWWADVMRAAMRIDAYDKPYFSRAGYYPMYLMPPNKVGGGLGDLVAKRRASQNVPLVSILAAQSGNGHWRWYVDQMGGPRETSGYVGFIRGTLPEVEPKEPDDLPSSRLFRGIGQAYLNSTIRDARDDVQVVFKSSPFGTQSHGYEANNSFLLWAYGQRLLIRSGRRDIYGSDHHRNWMWSTRSVNNITVDGRGQGRRTAAAKGRITAFRTTPAIDVVVGEAGDAYVGEKTDDDPQGKVLDRFTRAVLFVKPELVVVFDRLVARRPSTFEYWLHALDEMAAPDQHHVEVRAGDVVCPIDFLAPEGLTFSQTNQYDPNPRPRIKLREWHLTATTPTKSKAIEFVTLMRPHRAREKVPGQATLRRIDGGYVLTAALSDGQAIALLPTDDSATLAAEGLETRGTIVVERRAADGSGVQTVQLGE